MSNIKHIVRLASGKEVPWDEFMTWGAKKQSANLKPTRTGCSLSSESRKKISKALVGRTTTRKGVPLTNEHKEAVSKAKTKKLVTPHGIFDGRKGYAVYLAGILGLSVATAKDRYRDAKRLNPAEYYYLE